MRLGPDSLSLDFVLFVSTGLLGSLLFRWRMETLWYTMFVHKTAQTFYPGTVLDIKECYGMNMVCSLQNSF
jgi:hypothetical protein